MYDSRVMCLQSRFSLQSQLVTLGFAFVLLSITPAHGVEIEFRGTVKSSATSDVPDDSVSAGTPFVGRFEVENRPRSAEFSDTYTIESLDFTIGQHQLEFSLPTGGGLLVIADNSLTTGDAIYASFTSSDLEPIYPPDILELRFNLELQGATNDAINSSKLGMLNAVELSDFSLTTLTIEGEDALCFEIPPCAPPELLIVGDIDSFVIVPEPSSAIFLIVVFCPILHAFRLRKKHATSTAF